MAYNVSIIKCLKIFYEFAVDSFDRMCYNTKYLDSTDYLMRFLPKGRYFEKENRLNLSI
jgi:hypothetical protein